MLKDLLSNSKKVKAKQRGLLIPRINNFLLERDRKAPPRYPFWITDKRPEDRHHDLRFHPSSMSHDFCPRQWVLEQHELVTVVPEQFDSRVLRIFETGDAYHDMVQRWLAEMGILYGLWYCLSCERDFWSRSPLACPFCNSPFLTFQEVPIDDPSTGMLGHQDGEVDLGGETDEDFERIGVEIKSTNSRVYETLKANPMLEHKEQALHYATVRSRKTGRQKLLGETRSTFIPIRRSVILYINKDTSELREHVVDLSPENHDNFIGPRLDQMQEARAFDPKKLTTLPDRTCHSPKEGDMRGCGCVRECFKKFPPEFSERTDKRKRR